jgi:hypothetical protein
VKRDENAESLSAHGGQHSRWENWEKNHRPNVRAVSLDKKSCANKSAFSRRNLREEQARKPIIIFLFLALLARARTMSQKINLHRSTEYKKYAVDKKSIFFNHHSQQTISHFSLSKKSI